ncbi:unknown [Ruminococcus sp. CAG:353]|nr:unknown [Ruminococcus sp. CAG:353]
MLLHAPDCGYDESNNSKENQIGCKVDDNEQQPFKERQEALACAAEGTAQSFRKCIGLYRLCLILPDLVQSEIHVRICHICLDSVHSGFKVCYLYLNVGKLFFDRNSVLVLGDIRKQRKVACFLCLIYGKSGGKVAVFLAHICDAGVFAAQITQSPCRITEIIIILAGYSYCGSIGFPLFLTAAVPSALGAAVAEILLFNKSAVCIKCVPETAQRCFKIQRINAHCAGINQHFL